MGNTEREFDEVVRPKKSRKWLRNILIFLIVGLGVFVYIRYFYPFATGVKAGQLNYVVYKGYIFKTYEGKIIQAGFRAPKGGSGALESEKFEFSISDKKIAERLMLAGGKEVELQYTEYFGTVPWRGFSKYVVDSIIAIKEPR